MKIPRKILKWIFKEEWQDLEYETTQRQIELEDDLELEAKINNRAIEALESLGYRLRYKPRFKVVTGRAGIQGPSHTSGWYLSKIRKGKDEK